MRTGKFFTKAIFVIILTGIIMPPGCRQEPSKTPADTGPTVIVAIGDSLTWGALAFGPKASSGGYPTILETILRDEGYDVVVFNKGLPGEKAYQTRARFQRAIADADIALLMIGVNDIIRPEGCPEPNNCRTGEHIEVMIKLAAKADIPLLISTLTPAQNNCARSWANPPIQNINEQILALARKYSLVLADNHQAILEHGGAMLFSDCLHFTDDGYQVLAEHWYQALLHSGYLQKIKE